MLSWYTREYKKAWDRAPKFSEYWETENGFETLKADYTFAENNSFARFQANFNLIIALCPIVPSRFNIQEKIIRNVSKFGLEYFEARTVIPLQFNDTQVGEYLYGLCTTVEALNSQLKMQTRLVFSLFRNNAQATKNYKQLRDFIKANHILGSVISGIDFAFLEEGSPPKSKTKLFKQFHLDNKYQQPLDLLYHVGESYEDKGIASAIRWIWEAEELGASRLGHAIALGVDPENYAGKVVKESSEERLDTIHWLKSNYCILLENGYDANLKELKREEELLNNKTIKSVQIKYDSDYIQDVRTLQLAVAAILKNKKVVIETCPTSNLRIGQIHKYEYHPLRFFHKMGINYVTCTDDPGIFATDWVSEHHLAKEISSS